MEGIENTLFNAEFEERSTDGRSYKKFISLGYSINRIISALKLIHNEELDFKNSNEFMQRFTCYSEPWVKSSYIRKVRLSARNIKEFSFAG